MANPFNNKKNTVEPKHKEETVAPKQRNNILSDLLPEKPEAKAYSLYLDVDVIEAIDQMAAGSKGLNRSKIANALLRKALFSE